jgi:hypothetical protein
MDVAYRNLEVEISAQAVRITSVVDVSSMIPAKNPLALSIPERVPFELLLEHVGENSVRDSRKDLV